MNVSDVYYVLSLARKNINAICIDMEPWEIILYSVLTTLFLMCLQKVVTYIEGNEELLQPFLRWLRHLPVIRNFVENKIKHVNHHVEKQLRKGLENKVFLRELPKTGWSEERILKEVEKYQDFGQFTWSDGHVSGAVYHGNDEKLLSLVERVYGITAYTNPLHSDVFPGVRIMEAEIIRIVCSLYSGNADCCGAVTTGGTESIFLACKAYRDYAKFEKGIKNPNIVIPVTAHAAFDKAAHLLNMTVRHVPVDPVTTKVNAISMKKAINRNTCMLVGSAPTFPYGSIDPIEDIAKLGQKYNIPVHIDACLGGFLLPFMERAGYPIPHCDFTVPGVTSISVDTHKYAYAPKGSSIILYRNKALRHYQFSVQPNWPGGIYGTPNLSGSRAGGVIATCWASILYHGEEKYIESTRKIISVAKYIENGLKQIPGIYILGKPEVSVIAVGSKVFDVYRLSAALTQKGWSLNAMQFPSGFHICVTLQHTHEGIAEKFLADVRDCTSVIMKDPNLPAKGTAAIYGMAQQIPDRSVISELVWAFLDACYSTEDFHVNSDTEVH